MLSHLKRVAHIIKFSSHARIFATMVLEWLCQQGTRRRRAMQLNGYTTGGFERGVPAWKEALWLLVRGLFFQSWVPWPSVLRVGW